MKTCISSTFHNKKAMLSLSFLRPNGLNFIIRKCVISPILKINRRTPARTYRRVNQGPYSCRLSLLRMLEFSRELIKQYRISPLKREFLGPIQGCSGSGLSNNLRRRSSNKARTIAISRIRQTTVAVDSSTGREASLRSPPRYLSNDGRLPSPRAKPNSATVPPASRPCHFHRKENNPLIAKPPPSCKAPNRKLNPALCSST